jgi:hypothetical protein
MRTVFNLACLTVVGFAAVNAFGLLHGLGVLCAVRLLMIPTVVVHS